MKKVKKPKERKVWAINPKTRIKENTEEDVKLTKKEIREILKQEDF